MMQPRTTASAIARHDSERHAREERGLIVVPHVPSAEDPLQRAVAHRLPQDLVDGRTQRGVPRGEHPDVVAGGYRLLRHGEARDDTSPSIRDHVIEQHRVQASEHEVRVRVHVILVGDRLEPVLARRCQENVVRDGSTERADAATGKVGQRAEA